MSRAVDTPADSPVVAAIIRANRDRKGDWVGLKYERMGVDVFAFFRGTDHLFAGSWADFRPIEVGPSILICGDLHLENFGVSRTEDGAFAFDINDFDEATVAPCSVDLIRCATSILLAAQTWKLTPIQAIRTVLGFIDRYRSTVAEGLVDARSGRVGKPGGFGPLDELLGSTAIATQAGLLASMTRVDKQGMRTIRRSAERFPGLSRDKVATITAAVEKLRSTGPDHPPLRVLDACGRIAGIGSLGVRRYVVLVAGDDKTPEERLLDVKEACPSALEGLADFARPEGWKDEARRVVDAQRHLQASPTAGLDVVEINGRPFRVREMIPEENRARIDRFRRDASKLRAAVEVAGRVVARSQIRGSRFGGQDQAEDLARWAAGPGLDAVVTSAVRFAEKTREDFKAFRKARSAGEI